MDYYNDQHTRRQSPLTILSLHMKLHRYLLAAAFASAVPAADMAQSPVSSRKLSDTLYELTVTLKDRTEAFAAQGQLISEAKRVCDGQPFQFGHYAFESTERINNTTGSPEPPPPRLTLRQEVTCGRGESTSTPHTSYEWSPAETDSQLVAARTQEYLAQKDTGELALAYGQFSDGMKASARFDTWSKSVEGFNAKAGRVELRKIQKVSWVKDPPGVDPGFYAAVDYTGRFQNADYECGYVAWYRESSGRLTIVREEQGYIDRESQAKMSPEALRNTLAKIGCAASVGQAQTPGSLPESSNSTIGYPNVQAALEALEHKPGVTFRTENGWRIATDNASRTVWSFAPQGHPAYPAAVKRSIVTRNGSTYIDMNVHCEADKTACDNLVIQFQQLNERTVSSAHKGQQ